METIDENGIVGSMTHILNDYKSGGGYLDGDSKEIWQQLQTSINNFGNNIPTPPNNTPIILLKQQTKMLEDVLTTLNPEVYSHTLQTITNILKQGYYEVGDKQQLNEIRDMYQTKITNG
jgi:hypothetical protein